jgi:two-component system chemotaxis sensor kinase CheA
MTEELQLFCEDMEEQLRIMEETLLDICEISIEEVDLDMINKIFRAMHTMKGNAGMFGFSDVVSFAHAAESLLDEIRSENIILTSDMIDLFLLVNDHSKSLIDITVQNEQLDEEQLAYHNNLLQQLSDFLNKETNPSQSNTINDEDPIQEEDSSTIQTYTIHITLKEDFFISGMDIVSILKYLDVIGTITKTQTIDTNIPKVDTIVPLSAYLQLELEYETSEPIQEIQDAFEFVQEDIELSINLHTNKDSSTQNTQITDDIDEQSEQKQKTIEQKMVEPTVETQETKKTKKSSNKQKEAKNKNFSLRVDSTKVDKLINQISEMVISNAKVIQYAIDKKDNDFEELVVEMSEMLEDIRDGIMNIRMVQVGDSFSKLRRIVNDTAKQTNKEIDFDIEGGETELDKTVIEKISDPLVHLLRNSIDHGIEIPQDRIDASKPPKGTITLKAYPDAGTIVIQIQDDGKGINKDAVFNKAVEKGLIDKEQQLSDKDIYNLIFTPGFSTAQQISDISGRGVGMDVVKKNIDELRGSVEIDSTLGLGTLITIRLPLTLAIIDGFLVQVGDKKYIIPLDMIQECIELTKKQRKKMSGNDYITLRKQILPILDVREYFQENKSKNKRENIVVVKYGNSKIGLLVDELYGEVQTVIKPLGELFENIIGISGGTILGTGEIALIFDIPRLIEYKITNKEIHKDGD